MQERIAVDWLRPTWVPRFVTNRLVGAAPSPKYRPESFSLELAAARRFWGRRNEICHLLYGERMLEYLPRLAPPRYRRGRAAVASFHHPPSQLRDTHPSKRAMRSLDAVIALDPAQAEYLERLCGNDRVFVSPHGVDTTWFHPDATQRRDEHLFLCVGDNFRDFRAFATVVRVVTSHDPHAQFVWIVRHAKMQTRRWSRLEGASGTTSVSQVDIQTNVSDTQLRRAYQKAAALFMPLRDATANIALMEAMACGAPIVTTDVGGVPYYAGDSGAFLRERKDINGMCEDLLALANDGELRNERSVRARTRALQLDLGRAADKLIAVYRKLVG